MTNKMSCKTCTHGDICKHRKEFESLKSSLERKIIPSYTTIHVDCKHYIPKQIGLVR